MELDLLRAIEYIIFRFRAWGFPPGERVGARTIKPDGSLQGASFHAPANGDGGIDTVLLHTDSYDLIGVWAVTMEGITAHKRLYPLLPAAALRALTAPPGGLPLEHH